MSAVDQKTPVSMVSGASNSIGRTIAQGRTVTALANNAGASCPATSGQLDDVVDQHLRAPMLRASGLGRVVNLSSRAALAKDERLVYSATKAGSIGMTRMLGARRHHRQRHRPWADCHRTAHAKPPEDVARAALFFQAPAKGFVTGQVLHVFGATTLGVAPL